MPVDEQVVTKSVAAIEAAGLEKKYGDVRAVSGLNITVAQGELFGLVGADGAGKTTTMRILCTLSLPTAGKARVLGMDTVREAESIKTRIGYMAERFNLYPTLTVEENLDFFARIRNIPREVSEPRKAELLGFCRLGPFRERRAEHLSGGMQKKLALACSLIHQPEVIFLDEPTTGVDPVSRRDFWRIISGFLARGITVLVSTPYLDEAERFNRVAFMHRGQIIACDSPHNLKAELSGELLEIRARPVNRAVTVLKELPSVSDPHLFGDTVHLMVDDAEKLLPEIKGFLEGKDIAIDNMRRIVPGLEDVFVVWLAGVEGKETGRSVKIGSSATLEEKSNGEEVTIKVSELARKFGDFTAVDRVNFEIKRGEIFGLLGPNGSGKTTTIRMITGLLEPTSGSAFVLGHDMSRAAGTAQAKMGYMSQQFSLFHDLTVRENINFYGRLYGLSAASLEERKGWVLEMAGLRGKENLMPRELSGGWKQRLALGCAILHSPQVVFLDEPTSGVGPLSRRSFWELIQDLSAKGTTIFVTTHYMDEAEHCHRLGLMYQGQLIALGRPSQLKEGIRGELIEVASSDFGRTLEALTADARYRRASFFGSTVHVRVEGATAAAQEIRRLLESDGISVRSVNRIPFTMEDLFISLVEERESTLVDDGSGKGG